MPPLLASWKCSQPTSRSSSGHSTTWLCKGWILSVLVCCVHTLWHSGCSAQDTYLRLPCYRIIWSGPISLPRGPTIQKVSNLLLSFYSPWHPAVCFASRRHSFHECNALENIVDRYVLFRNNPSNKKQNLKQFLSRSLPQTCTRCGTRLGKWEMYTRRNSCNKSAKIRKDPISNTQFLPVFASSGGKKVKKQNTA